MGHKVHPTGFRIGVIKDWQAKWYADKHYAVFLEEDLKLRDTIRKRYADASVSRVEIERQANQVHVTIYTARPGIVIGRGGQRVDEVRRHLEAIIGKRVQLNIKEVQQPELDANLVARTVAEQMERRIAFRRAMKQAVQRTMQAGAKGIRVTSAGRLGGAEIARRLTMHEGRVPLHTLRADIDYGFTEARTTMGRIGVKVWIYKGDVLPEIEESPAEEVTAAVEPIAVAKAEPAVVASVEPAAAVPIAAEAPAAPVAPAEPPKEKPARAPRRTTGVRAPRKKATTEEKSPETKGEVDATTKAD